MPLHLQGLHLDPLLSTGSGYSLSDFLKEDGRAGRKGAELAVEGLAACTNKAIYEGEALGQLFPFSETRVCPMFNDNITLGQLGKSLM